MIYSNEQGIILRELTPEDEEDFRVLLCEESECLEKEDVDSRFYKTLHELMLFYVLEDKDKEGFIGYICVTPHNSGETEIGIYLSPDFRGKGIAVEFLPKAMEDYSEKNDVPFFTYRVKAYNLASHRVAKALGGVVLEEEGDLLHTRLLAFLEEWDSDDRERLIDELEKEYDPKKENVTKYRIEVKSRQ